ncbi:DUF4189 domain-containing protein [Stella sp.]|uniref:DUF4189 domain-containing protein n=1 Tax=Stella sp. TaxID=2912054 RepID=UPI0035AD9A0E
MVGQVWRMVFVLFSLSLWAAGGAVAQDCDLRCNRGCYGQSQSDQWKCEDDRRACVAACRSEQQRPGGSAAPAGRAFGAIAYSRTTGDYGYAHGQPSRARAEQVALGFCTGQRNRAADCAVLVWFWNACAALATAGNGAFGSDHAADRGAAQQSALRICSSYGGANCRVVQTVCSR